MKVAFVQETLRHYRVPFYQQLKALLEKEGITLTLFVGQADQSEQLKQDVGHLDWATRITNRRVKLGGYSLVWQQCLLQLRHYDLVIVEQASRMLINYVLLVWRRVGGPRVAFWGHGQNFSSEEVSRIGEWIKERVSTRVDWWFAYNDLTARIIEQAGVPAGRISSVMNTRDTSDLVEWASQSDVGATMRGLREIGLEGKNVGVFVGSLYAEKRLDVLISAAKQIRERVPEFELVIVGAGVDADDIRRVSEENAWIRYIGQKTGKDLAELVSACKVMMVPGFVGLVIIDAFALGVPLVTCENVDHPPEVDYMENGWNGLVVEPDNSSDLVAPYADAVVQVLTDNELRERLIDGCRRSAEFYTLENMVDRFAQGIRCALKA